MRQTVLIFGHSYATQFIDAFNQYAQLFDQNKYEVTIAYLTGEPDVTVKERTLAEHVLFLNQSKKSIRALKISAIIKLLALCREKKFQIVICHRYKPLYIMMWVAKFCNIPALIGVMHEFKTMSSLGRRFMMLMLRPKNMLLAGVSNAVQDDLRQSLWFVPKENIVTLYNVIDVELTEPLLLTKEAARSALHLSMDTFLFGHIARLVPNKDQASLIKAFALFKASFDNQFNVKLIIIGKGPLQASLQKLVQEEKLEDNVIFTGFLTQVLPYMKAFDCFILSSIQEAFGRVLLEAMIAKLPIIATKVNGIPEVLADTGHLVPPKDIAAFARAMQQIYHTSTQERFYQGEKTYQRAIHHYSIPIFKNDFWQLPLLQSLQES